VLFDGKPEAVEQATPSRTSSDSPTAPSGASGWSSRRIPPRRKARRPLCLAGARHARRAQQDGATIFDFGPWRSAVASRTNDDGTTSFITIDPAVDGFDFVVGERDGKRALIVREAQHEVRAQSKG
jgi:hypothetical protein